MILLPPSTEQRKHEMQPVAINITRADLLAKAIKKAGGQRSLARALSVNRTTIMRLLNGETEKMRAKTERLLLDYVYG